MELTYTNETPIEGKLEYVEQDKAINFTSENPMLTGDEPTASLVISQTLQLEFLLSTGQLLYVWGYFPKESWIVKSEKFSMSIPVKGKLFIKNRAGYDNSGSGYPSDLSEADAIYFQDSGHLVIGDAARADTMVEIATDTIVGTRAGILQCIVLRPKS